MKSITPQINVTPLIDVLLVLLIIFMVISPSKFTDFKTKIPAAPRDNSATPNPDTLIVSLAADSSLQLNRENAGDVSETLQLTARLREVFKQRAENGNFNETGEPEKTVFIRSPRGMSYGKVVKVIDAVKMAGASPIALQIDNLK